MFQQASQSNAGNAGRTRIQNARTPSTTAPSRLQTANRCPNYPICPEWNQRCAERSDRKVNKQTKTHLFSLFDMRWLTNCVPISVNGEWRYFRSCAYMGEPGIVGDERFCLMRTGTFNIFLEYCQCNSKDGCNSGGLTRANGYTILATMIFFALAFLHRTL